VAAAKGQGKRPEVAQLKAKREALRTEIQAAKANGKVSPEERAKFKAERAELRKEASALKSNRQFQAKKYRAGNANKV
jgi:ABC-type phosphate transport system auxiliary subunit